MDDGDTTTITVPVAQWLLFRAMLGEDGGGGALAGIYDCLGRIERGVDRVEGTVREGGTRGRSRRRKAKPPVPDVEVTEEDEAEMFRLMRADGYARKGEV